MSLSSFTPKKVLSTLCKIPYILLCFFYSNTKTFEATLGLFCWTLSFHRRRHRRKLWWDLASLYQNGKDTEGDWMKVDGDGWRAFQKSWAFPHRSPFWSKFIYKIVDFQHFSMLFIEGSRSIYDMRFQSWPATKWLLKIQKDRLGFGWGFPEFCLKTSCRSYGTLYHVMCPDVLRCPYWQMYTSKKKNPLTVNKC